MCLLFTYNDSELSKVHAVYLQLSYIIRKTVNMNNQLGNSVSLGERGEAFAVTYPHIWPGFQALSDEHRAPIAI